MSDTYDSAEAIRRWNLHARQLLQLADFDPEEGDPHRIVLLNPVLFALLPDVQGKRVLDAGCGEGYLCRKLARLGAHVTGVDYSVEMLAMARERTDPALGIRYLHGTCEHMDFLDPGSFDLVVSNMVLMDLPDHQAEHVTPARLEPVLPDLSERQADLDRGRCLLSPQRVFDFSEDRAVPRFHGPPQEVFLAGEVVIDRALRHPHGIRDLFQPRSPVPSFREGAEGGIQKGFRRLVGSFGDPRRRELMSAHALACRMESMGKRRPSWENVSIERTASPLSGRLFVKSYS